MRLDPNRSKLPEVNAAVRAYYAKPGNMAGGNLHIVLDDGNVGSGDIQHCIDRCIEQGDTDGEALARMILSMSKTQRRKIL